MKCLVQAVQLLHMPMDKGSIQWKHSIDEIV